MITPWVQQRLELVDLALVDRALRQANDIDTTGLLAGGHQHAVQEVQIEALRGRELEEAERAFASRCTEPSTGGSPTPAPRSGQGRSSSVAYSDARVRAAMTGGHLVPAGLDAGTLHARVAGERAGLPVGGVQTFGQDTQQSRVDARQRPRPDQELPAASAVDASLARRAVERDASPAHASSAIA